MPRRSLSLICFTLAIGFLVTADVSATAQEFRATMVGEGVISTSGDDVFPALNADESVLFFSRVKEGRGWSDQVLMMSRRVDGGWGAPEALSFSGGPFSDRAPRPTRDGSRLYFTSNRPLPGATGSHDPRVFNLWAVEREGRGWSAPEPLPEPFTSPSSEIHNSIDGEGTIYFASNREGGMGRSDIYSVRRTVAGYGPAVNLGAPVNTEHSQPDLFVSGDGQMMILAVTDHPDGFGGDDLYVSYRRDDGWTEPINLGPEINTPEYEYGPFVSGGYLYFSSHGFGSGNIYRIKLDEIRVIQ